MPGANLVDPLLRGSAVVGLLLLIFLHRARLVAAPVLPDQGQQVGRHALAALASEPGVHPRIAGTRLRQLAFGQEIPQLCLPGANLVEPLLRGSVLVRVGLVVFRHRTRLVAAPVLLRPRQEVRWHVEHAAQKPPVHPRVTAEQVEQFVLGQAVAGRGQIPQGAGHQRLPVVVLLSEPLEQVVADDAGDAERELFRRLARVGGPAAGLFEGQLQIQRQAPRLHELVEHLVALRLLQGSVGVFEPLAQELVTLRAGHGPQLFQLRLPLLQRLQRVARAGRYHQPHVLG